MEISDQLVETLIMALVGLAVTILGVVKYSQRKRLLKSGIKVEGIVGDLVSERSSSNDGHSTPLYYPMIEYKNSDQVEISRRYNIGSNPSIYKIGDVVTVIYDASDDREFIIDDKITHWAPLIITVAGVAAVVGSIIYYILTPDSAAMPPIN